MSIECRRKLFSHNRKALRQTEWSCRKNGLFIEIFTEIYTEIQNETGIRLEMKKPWSTLSHSQTANQCIRWDANLKLRARVRHCVDRARQRTPRSFDRSQLRLDDRPVDFVPVSHSSHVRAVPAL